jgi:leucyl-tRNA synthetase
MLAPIAPHITEEMWQVLLDNDASVHTQMWPSFNPAHCIADLIEMPVQVNGKVRGRIQISPDATNDEVETAARASVSGYLDGKEVKKLIVVPQRIVTLVTGD